MPSRQFAQLHQQSLQRLQSLVPAGCPLIVSRPPQGGFRVATFDERDSCDGRYQLVATWITGYVSAWHRLRPDSDHEVITCPDCGKVGVRPIHWCNPP